MGVKWQICKKCDIKNVGYTCSFAVWCIIRMAGQLLFDIGLWGFCLVWVGLDHRSVSSPDSGLGWVSYLMGWFVLGRSK